MLPHSFLIIALSILSFIRVIRVIRGSSFEFLPRTAHGYKPRRIFSRAIFCTPIDNAAVRMLSLRSRASVRT